MSTLIEQQAGYGAFYVLTIFSMIALVALGTGYIVVQRQEGTGTLSPLPIIMMGVFGIISLAGVVLFGYEFARHPVISVSGSLQPAVLSFVDPDRIRPVNLKAELSDSGIPSSGRALTDNGSSYLLRHGDQFVIKLVDFDKLESKYAQLSADLQKQHDYDRRLLTNFAKLCENLHRPADDQVCLSLKVLVDGMRTPDAG